MFYDELKSPYQYIYSWPILKKSGKFDFQWELKRLESIKMIKNFDVAIQNFVKLYNSKNELLNLVFSLYNQEDILNISFWGSYLAKKYNQLSDIDINIIIKSNYFNYDNIPPKMSEKYVEKISNKISIMVFWEDFFLNPSRHLNDFIITPNYLHRDLWMREWNVRSFRNVNIYGDTYETDFENINYQKNIKARIWRQLKFAEFIFDWVFDNYATEDRIIRKMSSRIWEAWVLLSNFVDIDFDKYYWIFSWDILLDPYELLREWKILEKYIDN